MLYNFIFSVNIVLPIFLVMFIGYFLRRCRIMTDGFISNGNFLVFKIALPVSLFYNVYQQDVSEIFDIRFIAFTVTATLVCVAVCWLGAVLFIKDKSVIGAFVHGAFRGNFVILGVPVMHSFIGAENSGVAALVILFTIPVYNVLAILVLSIYSKSDEKVSVGKIVKAICTNPLTIGIMIGLVLSLFDVSMPVIADRTVGYVAALTTPLALICLGGGLELSKYNPKIKYAAWAAALKVIITPTIAVLAAYAFGFRSYELAVILITFAVPTAITSFTMTQQMDGDAYVGSTNVLISTFISVFTLTGFIYVFVMLGLV